MAMTLEGSCRCGSVHFSLTSHTPYPYQLCYCSICRKTAGGGGYAINIMGDAPSLTIKGKRSIGIYQAEIAGENGRCEISTAQRHFCKKCASALWLFSPEWPQWVYPFASAIDTPLPVPPSRVHLLLKDKASWVVPNTGPGDQSFEAYPAEPIEDWHKKRHLWIR